MNHKIILNQENLTSEDWKIIRDGIQEIYAELIELIQKLYRQNTDNIDWIVSDISNRDIDYGSILYDSMFIYLLKYKMDHGIIPDQVIVKNNLLKKVLSNHLIQIKNQNKITIKCNISLKERVRPFINLFKSLAFFFKMKIKVKAKKTAFGPKGFVVLETFMYPGCIRNGRFIDRSFGNIYEYLTTEEKKNLLVIPQYLYGFEYLESDYHIQNLNVEFLAKESYLNLNDYLWAFFHFKRVRGIKVRNTELFGVSMNSYIRKSLRINSTNSIAIYSLLYYRFFKKLQESGMQIRKFIDWHENQALDKGILYSVKKFFSKASTIGYQGYCVAPIYNNHQFPTTTEKENNVLPDTIYVMGKKLVERLKINCPDLNVKVAPAFRYNYLHEIKASNTNKKEKKLSVLLILPVFRNEYLRILDMLPEILESTHEYAEYKLRVHPMSDEEEIKNKIKEIESKFSVSITKENFIDSLINSDVVVGRNSSSTLEALAIGKPFIVLDTQIGLPQNSIPDSIDKSLWQSCTTEQEFVLAVKKLYRLKNTTVKTKNKSSKKIKLTDYFEEPNRKKTLAFLGIQDGN